MRRIVVSLITLGLLIGAPASVLAAAPSNNVYDHRIVIGSLPFTDTVDTTEATSGSNDAELNASCGAPATDASVWYEYTAPADQDLIVDVSTSDYSAGVIIGTGTPGSFSTWACGPGALSFPVVGGETYVILAFDDQDDGIGNGGTLNFSLDVAPPPPTLTATVDATGTIDRSTGFVTVSGTLACSSSTEFQFYGEVRQRAGRQFIYGNLFGDDFCADVINWTVTTDFVSGVFVNGKAQVHLFFYAYGSGVGGGPAPSARSGSYGLAAPSAEALDPGVTEIIATVRLRTSH